MTWDQIEPYYDFQRAAWRNGDSGEVLAVEKRPGHVPWDHGKGWQAVLLPENYEEDNDVIEYLAKNTSEREASKAAVLYRENHVPDS